MSVFEPLDVIHLDLEPGVPTPPPGERDAFVVLWWRGLALAHLELTRAELDNAPILAGAISEALAPAIGARLFDTGFTQQPPSRVPAATEAAPPLADLLGLRSPLERLGALDAGSRAVEPSDASVIICTRGRPHDLARALEALRRAEPAPGEIVVVDNEPADPGAREVVERFGDAVYVPERTPGLSVARNTGIRAASGRVIAFVDDDTAVHEHWLGHLLRGLEEPRVLAVTGLVLPAQLETRAQVVFETAMGGASRGHRRIDFGQEFFEPQTGFGVPVWAIGAGANMAFRREAFDLVGLFDERLGAGATGCSEDSELWYRILAAGGQCRYVPDSVVHHWHRRDMGALRRQAHDYMRGHVAALFVQYANHGHRGNLRRALFTVPKHLVFNRALKELALEPSERTGTLAAEARGYLAGLLEWRLALPSRRSTRRSTAPTAS